MVVAAVAFAEPPPSKSYLPPSQLTRNAGYPQGPHGFGGAPQVVAARTLEGQGIHGAFGHGQAGHDDHEDDSIHGNGFARGSHHGHGFGAQGRHADQQGYDHNAAAFGRNAVEIDASEPANYNFGYMVNDHFEGTEFGHQEERHEEHAQGEYHVVLPDGRKQTVSYQADERGFKPHISYEESEDARSGYDANANNHAGYDGNGANGFHGNHNGHDSESHGDFSHHAGFGRNGEHAHNGKSRNGY
ncbi:pro-resilin-like [Bombyx mandarina]|uniref:Pro-resilin-like n=1 Tax=Bombyx mandarina TaxID=7092 RepID=A0A6J2K484_BOMMA|nr:pro-resilin-like [Bombyx mandarina]